MDLGLTSNIGEYYLAQQYRKNAAIGKSSDRVLRNIRIIMSQSCEQKECL